MQSVCRSRLIIGNITDNIHAIISLVTTMFEILYILHINYIVTLISSCAFILFGLLSYRQNKICKMNSLITTIDTFTPSEKNLLTKVEGCLGFLDVTSDPKAVRSLCKKNLIDLLPPSMYVLSIEAMAIKKMLVD